MNRTTSLTVNRDGSDLGRCFPDGWGGSHFDWRDGDIPVVDDFLRRESDQREDGLRRAAFHSEKSNRLKYNLMIGFNSTFTSQRQVYFLKLTFGR